MYLGIVRLCAFDIGISIGLCHLERQKTYRRTMRRDTIVLHIVGNDIHRSRPALQLLPAPLSWTTASDMFNPVYLDLRRAPIFVEARCANNEPGVTGPQKVGLSGVNPGYSEEKDIREQVS